MNRPLSHPGRGAALIIVLAFVVLLTGLCVAYFSRTISDRQIAHGSFNQSNADQLASSAAGINSWRSTPGNYPRLSQSSTNLRLRDDSVDSLHTNR